MSDSERPWPNMGPLKRWGPLAIVLVGFVVLAYTATTGTTVTEQAEPESDLASLADNPNLPITYAEAKADGTVDDYKWGNCDPDTGRVRYPSVYAPPCVPVPTGSNGGATSQGVTAKTIKIVWYQTPPGDITSAISGNLDPPSSIIESAKAYARMFEDTFETYGRKVEIVPFTGTGVGTDETAARADAVKVATQIKAFASIGGPAQTPVYVNELAARHVLCLSCGISQPNSVYTDDAPYLWGNLSPAEQFLENVGIVLTRELNDKPAKWAGDPKMRDRERVFGTIRYSQDPPVYGDVADVVGQQGEKYGWKPKVSTKYLLDLSKLPETAAGIIAKLKSGGVTTVVFFGDPIMPIYLTKAATAQNYYPEWIVTGTVLTDTTALARNYDQRQWAHAFGVSTLAVRTTRQNSDPYRIYRWYYGGLPAASKTASVFYPNLLQLFQGIHMAGANLTPETFAGGMFRLPPTGGQPSAAHVSYGDAAQFAFADSDFISVDDSTLIWWDGKAKGKDEQGNEGTGMYRYVNGGKRYMPGKMPVDLPAFFDKTNTVTTFDDVPPGLQTPDYPPPPGSPMAK